MPKVSCSVRSFNGWSRFNVIDELHFFVQFDNFNWLLLETVYLSLLSYISEMNKGTWNGQRICNIKSWPTVIHSPSTWLTCYYLQKEFVGWYSYWQVSRLYGDSRMIIPKHVCCMSLSVMQNSESIDNRSMRRFWSCNTSCFLVCKFDLYSHLTDMHVKTPSWPSCLNFFCFNWVIASVSINDIYGCTCCLWCVSVSLLHFLYFYVCVLY